MKQLFYVLLFAALCCSCQSGANQPDVPLTVSSESIHLGRDNQFQIDGSNWVITSAQPWLRVTPTSGNGQATITLSGEPNPAWIERMAILTITSGSQSINVMVKQPEKAPVPDDRVELPKDKKRIVKVITVYEDPVIENGKRFHQYFTPSAELWFDPRTLNTRYKAALEACSGGVVEYQIVDQIEASRFFTLRQSDGMPLVSSASDLKALVLDPPNAASNYGNSQLLKTKTSYDYLSMIKHYGFDAMRDRGEVHEIWVWSYPGAGSWESTYAGKDAYALDPIFGASGLWLNSNPVAGVTHDSLLVVMGLNYERNLACAMESYGHRFESVMWQVYRGWDFFSPKTPSSNPTNWDLYTWYDQFNPNRGNIGNIHFTVCGTKDYEWTNARTVLSFRDDWKFYPNLRQINPVKISSAEWGGNHEAYMRYWFSHLPNKEGVNPADGHFNNWWYYVVNYSQAARAEKALRGQ